MAAALSSSCQAHFALDYICCKYRKLVIFENLALLLFFWIILKLTPKIINHHQLNKFKQNLKNFNLIGEQFNSFGDKKIIILVHVFFKDFYQINKFPSPNLKNFNLIGENFILISEKCNSFGEKKLLF